MLHPTTLAEAQVAMLRLIPELVSDMGGDATKIYAYKDEYGVNTDLAAAIQQMPADRGLMVVWRGTGPRDRGGFQEVWDHRFSYVLRGVDPATAFVHVVNGIPSDGSERYTRRAPHTHCLPPKTPSIERRSLLIGQESVIDYFEISVVYTEKGDY
jgi:hypothetical protein